MESVNAPTNPKKPEEFLVSRVFLLNKTAENIKNRDWKKDLEQAYNNGQLSVPSVVPLLALTHLSEVDINKYVTVAFAEGENMWNREAKQHVEHDIFSDMADMAAAYKMELVRAKNDPRYATRWLKRQISILNKRKTELLNFARSVNTQLQEVLDSENPWMPIQHRIFIATPPEYLMRPTLLFSARDSDGTIFQAPGEEKGGIVKVKIIEVLKDIHNPKRGVTIDIDYDKSRRRLIHEACHMVNKQFSAFPGFTYGSFPERMIDEGATVFLETFISEGRDMDKTIKALKDETICLVYPEKHVEAGLITADLIRRIGLPIFAVVYRDKTSKDWVESIRENLGDGEAERYVNQMTQLNKP